MIAQEKPRLETAIRIALAPVLRADGFSGSGRTFRRTSGNWVHVVNIQASMYGGQFALNLAVHPLAIPDAQGNMPDPKKITESLCEFRRRLSDTETEADQWWKYDSTEESMLAAVTDAAAVFCRRGNQLFERACGPQAGFNSILASDFSTGTYDNAGFGSTEVRMALALAWLRKSEGKHQEAKAFAAYGLARVGSAMFLRRELEALATCACTTSAQSN